MEPGRLVVLRKDVKVERFDEGVCQFMEQKHFGEHAHVQAKHFVLGAIDLPEREVPTPVDLVPRGARQRALLAVPLQRRPVLVELEAILADVELLALVKVGGIEGEVPGVHLVLAELDLVDPAGGEGVADLAVVPDGTVLPPVVLLFDLLDLGSRNPFVVPTVPIRKSNVIQSLPCAFALFLGKNNGINYKKYIGLLLFK